MDANRVATASVWAIARMRYAGGDVESKGKAVVASGLRSLLGAVPWIGTLLTEVFIDFRTRVKQERLLSFAEHLAQRLHDLGLVDDFGALIETEEFGDLVESAARRAAAAAQKAKRERFAELVVNRVKGSPSSDYLELFLDFVAEFNEAEIHILVGYRSGAAARRAELDYNPELPPMGAFRTPEHYGMADEEYRSALGHLVSRGVLLDDGVGRWGTNAHTIFEVSPLGYRFLAFLAGDEHAPENGI